MALQPETLFKMKVKKFLNTLDNVWYAKVQQVGINGTPDFLLCVNGMFVAMELKAREKSKISKLQEYNIDKINKVNGLGFIVHPGNWETIQVFLKQISKGGSNGNKSKNVIEF